MSPCGGLMPMAPTSTRWDRSDGAMVAISAAIQPPKPRPTRAGLPTFSSLRRLRYTTAMSRTLRIQSGRSDRL
jgi:hypothetical protein